MSSDDTDHTLLNRRQFVGATAGIGLLGASTTGTARETGDGGNGDGGGNDNNGDGPSDNDRTTSVTLITGQTIHVSERSVPPDEGGGTERSYAIDAAETSEFHVLEAPDGTYLIPHGVDLDALDRTFFNVDYLLEYGYTDAERDAIPVVARFPEGRAVSAADAGAFGGPDAQAFPAANVVAADIPKRDLRASADDVSTLTADLEFLNLDRAYEAVLDESAPRIGAGEAREAFDVDGEGVRIAVIDTGIDPDHPDVGDRVVYEANFSADEFVHDGNGHGTHVAGIAAGDGSVSREDGDDPEYVGVAPGADLMNVKALGFGGLGYTSDIMAAVEDAVEHDADIINLSLGSPPTIDDPLADLVDWAHEQGVVVVSSAGNERGDVDPFTISSPATAAGAIAVGASDDAEAAFASARGPSEYTYRLKPEVSAPGVDITAAGTDDGILSEYPYATFTGTSMAAPHVAGLAALLLERDAGATPDDVQNRLVSTASFAADRDVYVQGGGEVDAHAALDGDLLVHDAVVDYGIIEGPTTATRTVTLENTADVDLAVDVDTTLRNETEDEDLDDSIWVDLESLTIPVGETASVEVTVDATDVIGTNAGVVTFETPTETQQAIVGFTKALDVTLEKTLHEERDSAAGDVAWAWSHDGAISHVNTQGFAADGTYNFPVFRSEATFTAWSFGALPGDEDRNQPLDTGDVVATIVQGATVDEENTTIEMDETETVLRTVDTSEIDERPTHDVFHCQTTTVELYGFPENRDYISYTSTRDGDYNGFRVFVTPVDEADPVNVATAWLFYPRHDRENRYDVDDVYWFYEPAFSIPEGGETISATENTASETINWYRDREGQLLRFAGHVAATDQENFPEGFRVAWIHRLHKTREEQTWHRTVGDAEYSASYRGSYVEDGLPRNDWWASRKERFVPTEPTTYEFDYNRYPITHDVFPNTGTMIESGRVYQDATLVDQQPVRIDYSGIDEHTGAWQVTHEGDVIAADDDARDQPEFNVTDAPAFEAGDIVGIHHQSTDHTRDPDVTVLVDYLVRYDPDSTNQPPQVADVHVPGLSAFNRIPPGETSLEVAFDPTQDGSGSATIADVEAYYAHGAAAAPFEDASGWHEAELTHLGANRYEVDLEATGEAVDLAFAATTDTGNTIRSTTLGAVRVGHSVEIRPDEIDIESNQRVSVVLGPTDGFDLHSIDESTLRFGAPEAITAGDGAPAVGVQHRGDGSIQAQFVASEMGFGCDDDPTAGHLVGKLADGTSVFGSDLIERIVCE